jgi:hypothetical protein
VGGEGSVHRIETAKHFPELQITVSMSVCLFSLSPTQHLSASSIGKQYTSTQGWGEGGGRGYGKKGKSEKCVKVYYSFLKKQLGLTRCP